MREALVMSIGHEVRWWLGNGTLVTEFCGKHQEVVDAIRRWPNQVPIFYHTHPNGFPTLSNSDIETFKGIVYSTGEMLFINVITKYSVKLYIFYVSDREIVFSKISDYLGRGSTIIFSQIREVSFDDE